MLTDDKEVIKTLYNDMSRPLGMIPGIGSNIDLYKLHKEPKPVDLSKDGRKKRVIREHGKNEKVSKAVSNLLNEYTDNGNSLIIETKSK